MKQVLHVDAISFGFSKEHLLFNDFSLSLKQGEIKAIVGKSGIGKSTLFELILQNLKPSKGVITASQVSEVFQDPYSSFHPSYTVLNQITDVAPVDDLEHYLDDLKLEYTLLSKLPHELSGGQLQRCSILRALLMKPELLLLDEPTSALDNVIQLDVMKMLLKYLPDMGMLLITHEIDIASWCADEIIRL